MDVCGRFEDIANDCSVISTNAEVYGHSFSERLKSFASWPVQMKQSLKTMAQAGFIYTGQSDKVYCFMCRLRVHKWMPEDEPLTEHFRLSPQCSYINMIASNTE